MFKRRSILAGGAALAAAATLKAPAILAQEGPIKIGIMMPLSGSQAQAGQSWRACAEIAIEDANRNGGLLGRQIEVVVRDDKATAAGALAAGRELHDLGVKFFIGGSQSPMALALVPMLEEFGAVLSSCATAMSLTHENFSRHYFRTSANAQMRYAGTGRVLGAKYPDVSKWASIAFDTAAGRDAVAAFNYGLAQTSKNKREFADPIYASPTATDFKVEIAKIMASDAQGLYLGLLVGPAITFLQQARSVGLTEKLTVIGDGGTDTILGRALKQSMPRNIWGRGFWYPQAPDFQAKALSQQLQKEYVAKMNDPFPIELGQLGHQMALALLGGIREAGSTDVAAVIAAMEGLEFDSVEGKQILRKEDHQVIGTGHYANYIPLDVAPFHGVREIVELSDEVVVEPPTPGVAFKRA